MKPQAGTTLVRFYMDSRVHDLMRDLSKRRREYLSLTYERAAIAFLKQDENYQGMDIAIPEHTERNVTENGRNKKERTTEGTEEKGSQSGTRK